MDGFHKPCIYSSSKVLDAFLVFGTFGLFSVLLDLDHITVLLQKDLPITAANLIYAAGRPLHYAVLVLSGIVCLYCLAHLYRLWHKAV